jgi:radical SAM protein with 4Fe4S-binding SPASM domain
LNLDTANPASTDNERAAGKLISLFKELSAAGIFEDPVTRKVKSFAFSKEQLHSCGAGGLQIAVMPGGDIGICHYAASAGKWLIGNINDRPEKVFSSQALAEWARRSPINMPACYACPGLVICGGGCPYDAYQKKGDLWGLDERFCTLCKETIKWMMQELYKAQPPVGAAKSAVLAQMEEVVAQTNFIRKYLRASPEIGGVAVTEEDLQRGADSFRRSNGLTSAKATEEWMSLHCIAPEFFAEFLGCAILFGTYKDRQKKKAASLEQTENLGR